jgi:hypothetical protein
MTPAAFIKNVTLPANYSMYGYPFLNIEIPNTLPPISDVGIYTFAIGATQPGTLNFVSNIATVSFVVD